MNTPCHYNTHDHSWFLNFEKDQFECEFCEAATVPMTLWWDVWEEYGNYTNNITNQTNLDAFKMAVVQFCWDERETLYAQLDVDDLDLGSYMRQSCSIEADCLQQQDSLPSAMPYSTQNEESCPYQCCTQTIQEHQFDWAVVGPAPDPEPLIPFYAPTPQSPEGLYPLSAGAKSHRVPEEYK